MFQLISIAEGRIAVSDVVRDHLPDFVRKTARKLRRILSRFVAETPSPPSAAETPGRSSVLFCTTNGAGLGHITRSLALADSLIKRDPRRKIVFLVTTPELSIIRKRGYLAYYVPYFAELTDETRIEDWQEFLMLSALKIFDMHNVDLLVFDGFCPFRGLLEALDRKKNIRRVWTRRGLEKPGATQRPDALERHFELVIRPLEAGASPVASSTKCVQVAPIISIDPSSVLDPETARHELGVPHGALAVYLQLGSGVFADISDQLEDIISILNAFDDLFVILAMSVLKETPHQKIRNGYVLKNYPNSRLFRGFDFTISAAGYNSVHEYLYCALPAILVPREGERETEDQLARAQIAEGGGAALVVRPQEDRAAFRAAMRSAILNMRDDAARQEMVEACARLLPKLGTDDAARLLAKLRGRGTDCGLQAAPVVPTSTPAVRSLDDLRGRHIDEIEMEVVDILVEPGATALDVGGHIGAYTVRMLDAGARVVVFECLPDAAEQLRRLFTGKAVEVVEAAASDISGEGKVFLPFREGQIYGARTSVSDSANDGFEQQTLQANLQRIDDLSLDRVSLLKIDVEGHEESVLRGARELITRDRPVLIVEIEERHHPGGSAAIIAGVEALDYTSWAIIDRHLVTATAFDFARYQNPLQAKSPTGARNPNYINNFIFLPAERSEKLLEQLNARLSRQHAADRREAELGKAER